MNKPSFYPSQLEVSITEQCNHNCDYCWVKKESQIVIDKENLKKGVDIFLALPNLENTITFTTNEPFMYPDIYKEAIRHILKAKNKDVNLVTTTNGLNLTREIADFLKESFTKIKDRFRLNISIDGNKHSHDKHRKVSSANCLSSFDFAWSNFNSLPKEFPRVICTVTPSEVKRLNTNIDFLVNNKFKKIDIFPQVFTIWKKDDLKILGKEYSVLVSRINNGEVPLSDFRALNRLWGKTHYNKLLLASDNNFYLFEWILAIPLNKRKRFLIGNTKKGIDLNKRARMFNSLFSEAFVATKHKCLNCSNKSMCGLPLPLLIWCKYSNLDFTKYFNNFCKVAGIAINAAKNIKPDFRNSLDQRKLK